MELENIGIQLVRESAYNPRGKFEDKAFEELVASIKEKGVLMPILVRSNPKCEKHYNTQSAYNLTPEEIAERKADRKKQIEKAKKTTDCNMKITSPLSVSLPRKTKADKKIYLNLNVYRNLHFIVNNQAKEMYNEIMKTCLSGLKFKGPISITFQLFKKTRRKTDRSNILSIVEKFFCDALVHYGCIEDDNDDHIKSTHYLTGGIDSENPRVEIEITESNN